MPEVIEYSITSKFINQISKDLTYSEVIVNTSSKVKTDLSVIRESFTLTSENKGKELKLIFNNQQNQLYFTMGMTGCWYFIDESDLSLYKHWKVLFKSGNKYLMFSDIRKFAKWKWSDNWTPNKGACILTEYDLFKSNLITSVQNKDKVTTKPLYEALLDQKHFCGLGNYLRSEILGRLNYNPNLSLQDIYKSNHFNDLLKLCKSVPEESLKLGGGQLKDWKNPFGQDSIEFKKFLLYYKNTDNAHSFKDSNGRTFWMDKKWITIDKILKKWEYLLKI